MKITKTTIIQAMMIILIKTKRMIIVKTIQRMATMIMKLLKNQEMKAVMRILRVKKTKDRSRMRKLMGRNRARVRRRLVVSRNKRA